MPLSIAGFPAEIAPILMSVFCLGSLVVLFVIGLVKSRPVAKTLSALGVSLLIAALGFAVAPAKVFQIGFRQRIRSTVSASELREIARVCRETLPLETRLPGPGKTTLWNESENRAQWNALLRSTALGKLDPSLTIVNGREAVEISWGGALVGHWGLVIQQGGKAGTGDLASDITTFISPM
jgi:hypothetical protein